MAASAQAYEPGLIRAQRKPSSQEIDGLGRIALPLCDEGHAAQGDGQPAGIVDLARERERLAERLGRGPGLAGLE